MIYIAVLLYNITVICHKQILEKIKNATMATFEYTFLFSLSNEDLHMWENVVHTSARNKKSNG